MTIQKELEKNESANNASVAEFLSQTDAKNYTANDDVIDGTQYGVTYILPETLYANDDNLKNETIFGISVQDAVHGEVLWDGTHVIFISEAGYTGPASFSYTAYTDFRAHETATVTLNVAPNTPPTAVDDLLTAVSNVALVISPDTLYANDFDSNGDAFEGVSIDNATNGTVSWDGVNVTFIPEPNYTGLASFTYTIADQKGGKSTATVNLTINAPDNNTAPDAQDDAIVGGQSNEIVIAPETLLANDSDIDGDTITGVSVQDGVNGTVIWDGTNVIFTADEGYAGDASFTYTITDNQGGIDTATVNLTIATTQNTAPVAVDDHFNVIDQASFTISPSLLLANDRDADGDAIEGIRLENAQHGTVDYDVDRGLVRFVPDADYVGPASFTYTITDNRGGIDTATVTLNIKPDRVSFAAVNNKLRIDADRETEFSSNYLIRDDIGTDKQIVSVQDAVNGDVALDAEGNVQFTPYAGYLGYASFTYTLQGNGGLIDTATVFIDVATPYFGVKTVESGFGQRYSAFGGSADIYNEQHLEASINVSPGFGPSFSVGITPEDGFVGTASFDFVQNDGYTFGGIYSQALIVSTATFNVIENFAPNLVEDTFSGVQNKSVVTPIAQLLANDTDPEGQALTLTSVQAPVNGTVAIENGNVVFTPAADFVGDASYTYTAIDNRGNPASATVNVNIKATTDTALTDGDEQNQLAENTSLIILDGEAGDLLNNAAGSNLVITSFTVGDAPQVYAVDTTHSLAGVLGANVAIRINSDGSYAINSQGDNFNGDLPTVQYTVRDDSGNVVTSALDLTVTQVNDAPTVSANLPVIIGNEGRYLVATVESILEKNVNDVDGDTLTITSVEAARNGVVEVDGNNIYFTPTADYAGDAQFEYVVSDGQGGSARGTYQLTVADGALLTVGNDFVTATSDNTIVIPTINLVHNDRIEGINSFNAIKASFASVQDAVNGTVARDGDHVVFTPDAGYTGPASFTYTMTHLGISETATVNLTIGAPAADAPFALQDDNYVVDGASNTAGISFNVLNGNDQLLDNFQPSILNTEVFNAINGQVKFLRGAFPNSPASVGFTRDAVVDGPTTFDYLVTDRQGNISIATVNVNFQSNQAPVGVGETVFVASDSVTVRTSDLLRNDIDSEGDQLSVVSVQNAVAGTVSLDDDTVSFVSDANEGASFEYSIGDGTGNFHFAKVEVVGQADGNFVGTDANDIMSANADNNVINGNAGDDVIRGGAGDDVLKGGAGADTFVWHLDDADVSRVSVDRIVDFTLGEDQLDIKDLIAFDTPVEPNLSLHKLDFFLDFDVADGNTKIDVRHTLDAEVSQSIILEGVALVPSSIPFLVTDDSKILSDFASNIVY